MSTDDRRQRLRDQMKDFYGDRTASKTRLEVPKENQGIAPEMDLDSEYFSVMKYTTDLMRRKTLKGLVEADTELLRSVRRLDGALQELVYRNYAKFIAATDTIREMRDNVGGMDAQLQTLSTKVSSIDAVSQVVSQQLREHRSRIEKTISTNRMLKKVQFLTSLPGTMRVLLDKGEYGVCVKYWVAGDGFLSKHDTLSRIEGIHSECRALAQELYKKLEDYMCAVSLDEPEAMETIRRVVEDLRLLRATSIVTATTVPQDPDSDASFEVAVLKTLMTSVSANFANGVAAVQRSLRVALAVPDFSMTPPVERADALEKANLREALALLKRVCALLSVNSEKVYAIMNRLDDAKVGIRVTQDVQPVLVDVLTPIATLLGDLAVGTIDAIASDGLTALASPETISTVMQAAVNGLLKQLKQTATTLKTLAALYLDTAHSQQSHSYAALVDGAVCSVLLACAKAWEGKVAEVPSQQTIQSLAPSVAETTLTGTSGSGVVPPTAVPTEAALSSQPLLGFCVSRFIYAAAARTLRRDCPTQLASGEVVAADRLAAVVSQLGHVAEELQHRGVMLLGQCEAAALAPAFDGGQQTAATTERGSCEPRSAADDCHRHVAAELTALVKEWAVVDAVLQSLPAALPTASRNASAAPMGLPSPRYYGTSSSGPRSAVSANASGRSAKLTVSYIRRDDTRQQLSLAQIFSSESALLLHTRPQDGRVSTTMGCVVLYILKALVDHVRETEPFTMSSFQQVQIGATFLLRAVLSPAKDTVQRRWRREWEETVQRRVQQLLDEVCISAYDRYETKVPLSDHELESILMGASGSPGGLGPSPSSVADGPSTAPHVSLTTTTATAAGAPFSIESAVSAAPQPLQAVGSLSTVLASVAPTPKDVNRAQPSSSATAPSGTTHGMQPNPSVEGVTSSPTPATLAGSTRASLSITVSGQHTALLPQLPVVASTNASDGRRASLHEDEELPM